MCPRAAPTYPAAASSVIAVGATADGVSKASFSNFGTWVDITAPGSWILSTVPNNNYDHKSGTSMSSPIVAGVAALLKSRNPSASPDAIKKLLYDNTTETTFYVVRGGGETIGGVSAEISFPFEIVNASIPTEAIFGESVSFSASASEAVEEYEWTSSIDGVLGTVDSFTLTNLSLGNHLISVRARNASGVWTPSASQNLVISEERIVDPNDNNNNIEEPTGTVNYNIRIRRRKGRFYAAMSRRTRRRIRAFRWTSDKDGIIADKRSFRKRRLSPGGHVITLQVQDINGNWTNPLRRTAFKFQ